MDRLITTPDIVSDALALIGLPACACDEGGRVFAANVALCALLGFDPVESAFSDLFCALGEAGPLLVSLPDQLGAAPRCSGMLMGADGTQHVLETWGRPLPARYALRGTCIVFSDITPFQRDQLALRKSLLKQQAIFDNAAVGIIFTETAVIRECNMRAAEMFGYARADLIGTPSRVLYLSQDSYDSLVAQATERLSSGLSFSTELEMRCRDGAPRWFRVLGRAIDPLNVDQGVIWIVEDNTQQRQNDANLRRASLEMDVIMGSAPLAIGFQRDRQMPRYNQRFAELFGLDGNAEEELDPCSLYVSPQAWQDVMTQARPLLARGEPFKIDMQMRRRDGHLFWVHAFLYALNPGRPQQDTIWMLDERGATRASEDASKKLMLEQKAILDNASIGILFLKAHLMLRCNPRMADMFGYTSEEMTGQPARILFPTEQAYHAFNADATPLLSNGEVFERPELEFMRNDGSRFWCRVRANAVDSEQRDQGTIWIMEDVSLARQAHMEVHAIMDNASISVLFTKNRVVTRYNRGFAEMFGYEGDEALGMPGRALYPTEQAYEQIGQAAIPLLSVGKPFQIEMELCRKDGSNLWAQLIAYVLNPDEPAQGTIWIIEDRTEHKRAEQSLRNALLENQAILDSAVLGIAVVEQGITLRCNRKMEELFGYAHSEVDGLPVMALYPDRASYDHARAETARNFNAGRVTMAEYQLVRKDGSTFWARLSGRPFDLADDSGRSVWVVDDVTARREAGEAVRRARDELELRVLERTAELAGANELLQGEISERRQAEARVHHMAYHDSLTGLPNRALLADRLERTIMAAQRQQRKLAVMFLDLDRFKMINDSLGHVTGDHLLKEVANRLCQAVRVSDTVARLGGDEFVVLVPGIHSPTEAAQVAEKIIDMLALPIPFEGRDLHITPSIGICVFPDDGVDVETMMRHADAAMYHAKASGRNNYQFFTQTMNQAASQHFELESDLRGALAQGQFELYYQPIIDIGTRRLHTMEVLLRWRRDALGLTLPDRFIPILEDNGQIVPVGEWVLRTACEQSVRWLREGKTPVPLSVNLSPRQFMHRGLVESIQRILFETGIDPSLIEFEITETALMQHGVHTLEILDQINRMGIRLSIDDFGTGYSSLAYLKRFPVKKIKIDRAFVKDLEHSSEDQAIVAAIMALSCSLQLSVVAEGVETQAQYRWLQEHGCQYAQGYLFARPLPLGEAERVIAATVPV